MTVHLRIASIWRENMLGNLSADLSVPRSEQFSDLERSLKKTVIYETQIMSEHIVVRNGGYFVYYMYPSDI